LTSSVDSGNVSGRDLSGQHLEQPVPLNANTFTLFANMCRVDGAVHVNVKALELAAFACLLDGESGEKEELSRGARFNSAQRYSRKTKDMVVIVVSEDGPVTIFESGEATAAIEKYILDHECDQNPPMLKHWMKS
jgi:DNA integrity scanning protein DisA with diadenylate cyclase activity